MSTKITRLAKIADSHNALLERITAFPTPGRILKGGISDHVAGRLGRGERGDEGDEDNFNEDGSRKDRHERKPRFKVELLCRTFVGDVGFRPIPDGICFWESPDIWIEGPSGDPDRATPGLLNTVKVHIWNNGLADCWGAQVDLFWCNPSLGINAAAGHLIGSKNVPLASGMHTILSFDWIPTIENNGHECLVAQVYDPLTDPIVAPFNPVQDRHVAQRNISVVSIMPGQALNFEFFSQNLSWVPASTTLEIQRLEGKALKTLALALGREPWNLALGSEINLTGSELARSRPIDHARIVATGVFREALQDVPGSSEVRRKMNALRDPVGLVSQGPPSETIFKVEEKVHLDPGQFVRFSFQTTLPETADEGSANAYRIVERAAGRITGGLTIVIEVAQGREIL